MNIYIFIGFVWAIIKSFIASMVIKHNPEMAYKSNIELLLNVIYFISTIVIWPLDLFVLVYRNFVPEKTNDNKD